MQKEVNFGFLFALIGMIYLHLIFTNINHPKEPKTNGKKQKNMQAFNHQWL